MSAVGRVYLDHNATSPLRPEARAAMIEALDLGGNPSSVHGEGRRARALVETARGEIAAIVGARASEIVFTSGASEANAWVAGSPLYAQVVASDLEHPSVLAPASAGRRLVPLAVGGDGRIDVGAVEAMIRLAGEGGGGRRTLVAAQLVNNETGVIQPVAEIARIAHRAGAAVLCDAVQAAGRIAIDRSTLGADLLTLSAHKVGGPAGVGALVIDDREALEPLVLGGGQERRRRAGTENVAGIVGFAAALRAAERERESLMRRLGALRDRLEAEVASITPAAIVIGRGSPRVAGTSAVALTGQRSETMVIRLDLAGVAASAGAACSSGKVGASRALAAMGLAPEVSGATVRLSLGWSSRGSDVERFLAAWREIAADSGPRRKVA
jgi:cysteine desulfurase